MKTLEKNIISKEDTSAAYIKKMLLPGQRVITIFDAIFLNAYYRACF